jgi:hypothetical protein
MIGAEEDAKSAGDKGYHSRAVLKELDGGPWKKRIDEAKQRAFSR